MSVGYKSAPVKENLHWWPSYVTKLILFP